MHTLNLSQSDITAYDGTPVRLVYDSEADMLEIFFGTNEPATGIEITEHIVLRLNLQTKRAVSLLLLDFSILTERTEYGPCSYPLTTLHEFTWRGPCRRAPGGDIHAGAAVFESIPLSGFTNRECASDLRRSATV